MGFHYTAAANAGMKDMYDQSLLSIQHLNGIRQNILAIERDMHMVMLTDNKLEQQRLIEDIAAKAANNNQLLELYEKLDLVPFETEKLSLYKQELQQYRSKRQPALDLVLAGKKQEAYLYYGQNVAPHADNINLIMKSLVEFNTKEAEETKETSDAHARVIEKLLIIIPIVATILSLIFGIYLARMISRRLQLLTAVTEEVAGGNLRHGEITADVNDEIGAITNSLNHLLHNLRALIKKVASAAEQVAASSEELSASADQSADAANQVAASITGVAQGSEKQFTAIDQTTKTITELSAAIQQIAANASTMESTAAMAAHSAAEGNSTVDSAVRQINTAEKTVFDSGRVVERLGERSKEIGNIVDTISEIAGQTNLLALNAAIEAARAGEAGHGFAVVAEEVRKLAEQSHESAQQIAGMISEIQAETANAVTSMQQGTSDVKIGAEAVVKAGQEFEQIASLISNVSSQVKEIAASIGQMASGSQKIVTAIRDVDVVSKSNASQTQSVAAATEEQSASMQEIAASSQALAKMAEDLKAATDQFKL
jgi:methyl-accepting chemotaxis protein